LALGKDCAAAFPSVLGIALAATAAIIALRVFMVILSSSWVYLRYEMALSCVDGFVGERTQWYCFCPIAGGRRSEFDHRQSQTRVVLTLLLRFGIEYLSEDLECRVNDSEDLPPLSH